MKNCAKLEKLINKQVHLNIIEIKTPELDAKLVAENIANQLSKGLFRRAMKQALCVQCGPVPKV